MREKIRSGKASSKAGKGVRQVATAKDYEFRCSTCVPRPPNSLLNSVEETLVVLVSGLGGVLGQEALVLITAQLLPVPPRVCHLPSLVLSVLICKTRGVGLGNRRGFLETSSR